jgi:hypothetical protein
MHSGSAKPSKRVRSDGSSRRLREPGLSKSSRLITRAVVIESRRLRPNFIAVRLDETEDRAQEPRNPDNVGLNHEQGGSGWAMWVFAGLVVFGAYQGGKNANTNQWDRQADGSFKIHREASDSRGGRIDLTKPVYIDKDAVSCPQIALLGIYLDGQRYGGDDAGHRAVVDAFVHPPRDCGRTLRRDLVRVLDKTVADDKLVDFYWPGAGKFQTLPSNLSN